MRRYTFTQFFAILDKKLKQCKAYGDRGNADSYRFLPKDDAKRVISEVRFELASENPDHYYKEQILEIRDFTSANYASIVDGTLYTQMNGETIDIPDRMLEVFAFWYGGNWQKMYDSSYANRSWWSPNNSQIIVSGNTFAENDQIKFFASVLPEYIKDNFTVSSFEFSSVDGHFGLYTGRGLDLHDVNVGDKFTFSVDSPTTKVTVVSVDEVGGTWVFDFGTDTPTTDPQIATFDTDNDYIDFPPQFMSYFMLEIKARAYQTAEKPISSAEWAQLQRQRTQWNGYKGKINHVSLNSTSGFGYGKR